MATSAVPAAINALIQILGAVPALAEVAVIDGPPSADMSAADFVAVGWSGTGEDQAAEAAQDFAYAGARARNETFTITGWLESWDGGEDFAVRRARAYELLGILEDCLRATGAQPEAPTLLGTVQWAHLTHHKLQQAFTDSGARVGIGWTVTCQARI